MFLDKDIPVADNSWKASFNRWIVEFMATIVALKARFDWAAIQVNVIPCKYGWCINLLHLRSPNEWIHTTQNCVPSLLKSDSSKFTPSKPVSVKVSRFSRSSTKKRKYNIRDQIDIMNVIILEMLEFFVLYSYFKTIESHKRSLHFSLKSIILWIPCVFFSICSCKWFTLVTMSVILSSTEKNSFRSI